MHRYKIVAQSMFCSKRITKSISADSEDAAFRSASAELFEDNYYVLSVETIAAAPPKCAAAGKRALRRMRWGMVMTATIILGLALTRRPRARRRDQD